MERSVIEYVVQLLNDGGIRAAAALPPGNLIRVTEPVAAVSLAGADTEKSSVTVLVEIVGPERLGGSACQLKALSACGILAAAGMNCQQGSCSFLNKGNLFCVPVTAVCYGENSSDGWAPARKLSVQLGQVALENVVGFSAEQVVEGEHSLAEVHWEFAVEEFFPWGTAESSDPPENFVLTVSIGGKTEQYQGCEITWRQRIAEETGIRQSRGGTATGRTTG